MKQVINISKDIEYKKRVIKLSKIYEDNNNEFLWKVFKLNEATRGIPYTVSTQIKALSYKAPPPSDRGPVWHDIWEISSPT